MSGVEFDSTKKPLDELLKKPHDGVLQLPEFQRGWVWDDEACRFPRYRTCPAPREAFRNDFNAARSRTPAWAHSSVHRP